MTAIKPIRPWRGSRLRSLRTTISLMREGDFVLFLANNKHPYMAAKQVGARITTHKEQMGGWIIRRLS